MAKGTANIKVTADTRKARKSLKKTGKAAKGMGRDLKGASKSGMALGAAMGPVAAGAAVATAGLVAAAAAAMALARGYVKIVKTSVALATDLDNIGKKARSIGATAESLQLVVGAMELSGVGAEQARKAMQKLQQSMGEAMKKGAAKSYIDAFDALGVSAAELAKMPLIERMTLVSKGMANMGTMAEQSAQGSLIMGRAFKDVIVAFEDGGPGFEALIADMERYGVATNKSVRDAEEFMDAQLRVSKVMFSLKSQILEPMIPVLTGITNGFADVVLAMPTEEKVQIGQRLADVTGLLAIEMMRLAAALQQTAIVAEPLVKLTAAFTLLMSRVPGGRGMALDLVKSAVRDLPGITDRISGAGEAWQKSIEIMEKAIKEAKDLSEIPEWLMRVPGAPGAAPPAGDGTPPAGGGGTAAARGPAVGQVSAGFLSAEEAALSQVRAGWSQMIMSLELQRMGQIERVTAKEEADLQKLSDAYITFYNQIEAAAPMTDEGEADARAQQLDLDRQFEQQRTAIVQQASAERAEIESAAMIEVIQQRQQIAMDVVNQVTKIGQNTANIMAMIFEDGSKRQKAAMKVAFVFAQSAALAQAIVATSLSVAQALAQPPGVPATIPFGILAGILGATEIATIGAATIKGVADAGLPPGALRAAGLNKHTALAVRNDEMVIDPVGTRAISDMLTQRAAGEPITVNTTLEIDGNVLGQTVDQHLIRSAERGMPYSDRERYGGI